MTPTEPFFTIGTVGHWGIWDTVLGVWIGTDAGPITYENDAIAHAAASVFNYKFGYAEGIRLQAKRYDATGNRLRDYIDPVMDGRAAIRAAEGSNDEDA